MLCLLLAGLLFSDHAMERTCFQTGQPYSDRLNLKADVAVVYGLDKTMPARVESWRKKGYRVHLMTGVAWGEYQDYLYGRFDGANHEDEAQTDRDGKKISHGGDVYYMSPGESYGKFLSVGVRKALDAGVEAVHLEEPEYWSAGGYNEAFKRDWLKFYGEPWQAQDSSPDARWRSSKLKYFLYRRALQQVFDSVSLYNRQKDKHVRCYVPTHSLLNYAQWGIVSPESSLARLKGCDGYIAQVWTGTARTPNVYRGVSKERTFETAYLEYGAMHNLVRATGRRVWFLADPVEDDPKHDWGDYRRNWESTLTASLLHPEVASYEVMPWPERVFNGTYPAEKDPASKVSIPAAYATELQVVMRALKEMPTAATAIKGATGVVVSDSLMFERGEPNGSDDQLSHFYGLAMPFVKRGIPVQPVQLESVTLPHYLDGYRLLVMTYRGMKPLTPEVHQVLAHWVRRGGLLAFVDDDSDPYNHVRDWWNTGSMKFANPREHLFRELGITAADDKLAYSVGKGKLVFVRHDPSWIAHQPQGGTLMIQMILSADKSLAESWKESSSYVMQRGKYVVAAGMDESRAPAQALPGRYIDLFDSALSVKVKPVLKPGERHLFVDLDAVQSRKLVAAAGEVTLHESNPAFWRATVEGIESTDGLVILKAEGPPKQAVVEGQPVPTEWDAPDGLLKVRFALHARAQTISIAW